MIKIIYLIKAEEKDTELQWLRLQKVYPSCANFIDRIKNIPMVAIGVIVGPEAALSIKLRHKLEMQVDYFQR